MEIAKLEAKNRQASGTRTARRLRKDGQLPGIVYGHEQEPRPVMVDAHEMQLLLEHGAHLIELQIDGQTEPALIKEVQFTHLGTEPVHVDFVRVARDERVMVRVPFEFKGTPVGLNEGGILEHDLVDIEIECLATEIPENIRVPLVDLHVNQSLHVRDLQMPPNVEAITPGDLIVCAVRAKKVSAEEVPTPEGEQEAEPEIIKRKKEEEAGER